MMCDNAATNLREYCQFFVHKAPDLKYSRLLDCSEVWLLSASDSPVTLSCLHLSGHFGNISGLSLWNYYKHKTKRIIILRFKLTTVELLQQDTIIWLGKAITQHQPLQTLVCFHCCSQLILSRCQLRVIWAVRAQSVWRLVVLQHWHLWWDPSCCCHRLQSEAPNQVKPGGVKVKVKMWMVLRVWTSELPITTLTWLSISTSVIQFESDSRVQF